MVRKSCQTGVDTYRYNHLIKEQNVNFQGHIAKLIGAPENSRQVGFALKHLPRVEHLDVDNSAPTVPEFHIDNVPWQRVLGAGGKISMPRTRYHQIVKLREEIPVDDDGSVSLAEFGWFPDPDTWDLDNELASET